MHRLSILGVSILRLVYSALAAPISDVTDIDWKTGIAIVDSLVEALNGTEKVNLVTGTYASNDQGQAGYVLPVARLGIPAIQLTDGEAGVNIVETTTSPPMQLNVGATWDKFSAYAQGAIGGREAKLTNMTILLSPRVNILRDPVEGNFWQSYSEDPFLNAQLGVQGVYGIQDQGTLANSKQIGPSSTGASGGDTNSIVDLQVLHEIYWAPHEALLKAGAASIMCSYAHVNGVPACESEELLKNTIRGDWNYTGIVLTDWDADHSTSESIMNGLDLEMPSQQYYGTILYDSIYVAKNLSESYLNRAVGHILSQYYRFGLLNTSTSEVLTTSPISSDVLLGDANPAYEIAVNSGILLKNDNNVLPLTTNSSFAVIGPNGLQYTHGTGFSERSWGVEEREISPLFALNSRLAREVPSAVGVDVEGTVIPSDSLVSLDGTAGLTRTDTVSSSSTVDATVDFDPSNALPANTTYTWSGYLRANTSGLYRLSIQRKIYNDKVGTNLSVYDDVWNIGELYVNGTEVASGYRLLLDGGAHPWSGPIITQDGWDNIGTTVYLEAGLHNITTSLTGIIYQNVTARLCWVTPEAREQNIQTAVALAQQVSVPVVFGYATSPADVAMHLNDFINELIERVAAVNSRTVVVLNNAEPVVMPWISSVSSILEMAYPGQEGGWATADLLLGNRNPQGHLPVTYPVSLNQSLTRNPDYPERVDTESGNATFSEGINCGYRWYHKTNTTVLFPFGYGLSYTQFEYGSSLSVSVAPEMDALDDTDIALTASFIIKNVGDSVGATIPQLYLSAPTDTSDYPDIQFASIALVGFDKVELSPFEERTVWIRVPKRQLSFWEQDTRTWQVAKGEREVWLGRSAGEKVLSSVVDI